MIEPAKPRHYKDLLIWQRAMSLAKLVYQLTSKFPSEERYGLTAQLRRAAVSVPSNIAEGQARKGTSEFVLSVAEGSLAELETQLLLSVELSFSKRTDIDPAPKEIDELQKMIVSLKRRLRALSYSPFTTRHSPLPSRSH